MSCLFDKILTSISRDLKGNTFKLCHLHLLQDLELAKRQEMQYLIHTSSSNFLHNVPKNVTIFNVFANSQTMCVSWLIFISPAWFYELGSKNYFQIHRRTAVHCSQSITTSEIQMSVRSPIMDHHTSSTH